MVVCENEYFLVAIRSSLGGASSAMSCKSTKTRTQRGLFIGGACYGP